MTQSYDKNPLHQQKRETGRDLTQSYTHRKIQKAKCQHNNATINFDNTTIAGKKSF